MNYKTLVFGCSGTIGLEFINVNKDKNILYYSRKKPKKISKKLWRYVDLNKKINNVIRERLQKNQLAFYIVKISV